MRLAAAAVRAGRQDARADDADAAAAELACNDAGSFMAISPDVHMAQGRLADSVSRRPAQALLRGRGVKLIHSPAEIGRRAAQCQPAAAPAWRSETAAYVTGWRTRMKRPRFF